MDSEYSKRLNFLERVAVDNLMKTTLDKMIMVRMESRQRENNIKRIKQTLVLRRKKFTSEY